MQTFDQAENTTKSKHEHSTIKLKITKHQNKKNNNKKKLTLLLVKTTQAVSIENNSWELHLWTSSSQTTKSREATLSLYLQQQIMLPNSERIQNPQTSGFSFEQEQEQRAQFRSNREESTRSLNPNPCLREEDHLGGAKSWNRKRIASEIRITSM